MTDLLAACYRCLDPFMRMFGDVQGARLIEHEGSLSSVVPSIPSASIFNATTYDHARPEALDAALTEAEQAYAETDVKAWGAWIIEGDAEGQRIASRHGMKLDSSPRAMGAELSALDLSADTSNVTEGWDLATAARLNELGYAVQPGIFKPLGDVSQPDGARCFIIEHEGALAGSVVTCPNGEDDCGVFWVATDPVFQGRGIARAGMTAALRQAIADGHRTTTLQGTQGRSAAVPEARLQGPWLLDQPLGKATQQLNEKSGCSGRSSRCFSFPSHTSRGRE